MKTTAFDLQINLASPGLIFHKLDKVRDRDLWSVRVGSDIRLIVHRTDASLLLCASQLVEVREAVQEVIVPVYVQEERKAPPKAALFAEVATERMLAHGVPVSWLDDVLAATEDHVLDVAAHLPAEAAEAPVGRREPLAMGWATPEGP